MRCTLCAIILCCCAICISTGCSKKIVSSSGKVWYSPDNERQPFQQSSHGNTGGVNEFDNEVFVRGSDGTGKMNVAQQNNQFSSRSNDDLEKAVNASFVTVQSSALSATNHPNQQVDLTSSDKTKNTQSLKSGNVTFLPTCAVANDDLAETRKVKTKESNYKIQCGNYTDKLKAKSVADKLINNNISDVRVEQVGTTYKIFVGNFADKNSGQHVFRKIKELGYDDIFWVYQ